MAKKKESLGEEIIDEVKEIAEDVAEKGEEIVEKVVKKVKESVSGKKKKKEELSDKDLDEGAETEELKEKIKAKKKSDTLLPLDDYVKSGIYLGTRVVTPDMRKYVYRRRADGLAILNTDLIDEMLKEGITYLTKYNPEEIIIVCKRQAGWKVVEKFSQLTGIRVFTKKYPAGILTNTDLPDFFEVELAVICDSWLDKNALNDIRKVGKKILMISDTNNFARLGDKIIIGNNKSNKSLGLMFYLLTKGYMKAKEMDTSKVPDLDWWTGELEEASESRKVKTISERTKELAEATVEGV